MNAVLTDDSHHMLTLALDNKLFWCPSVRSLRKFLTLRHEREYGPCRCYSSSMIAKADRYSWAKPTMSSHISKFADGFPSASVVGTDLSPIQAYVAPPNVQFEPDDAQLEWVFVEKRFDFVHICYLRHHRLADNVERSCEVCSASPSHSMSCLTYLREVRVFANNRESHKARGLY